MSFVKYYFSFREMLFTAILLGRVTRLTGPLPHTWLFKSKGNVEPNILPK